MDSTVEAVSMDRTSIQVSEELADELYQRKGRGTSYEEFIWSLLERVDEDDGTVADAEVHGSAETTLDDSEPVERVPTASTPTGVTDDEDSGAGERAGDDMPAGLETEFPATVDPAAAWAAVLAAREFLAEEGAATKGDLVREVMPEHPLGYDVEDAIATVDSDDRYRGSWWRRCLKPGLEAVEGVEKPTGGRSRWRHTGDGEGD